MISGLAPSKQFRPSLPAGGQIGGRSLGDGRPFEDRGHGFDHHRVVGPVGGFFPGQDDVLVGDLLVLVLGDRTDGRLEIIARGRRIEEAEVDDHGRGNDPDNPQ